ncbi:MAG: hypothetical protein KGH58_02935 [Candidatus Micrarchaeota archaeon]|nr:hypothetical protein [Candidatus Micrarchaeota archaeon]
MASWLTVSVALVVVGIAAAYVFSPGRIGETGSNTLTVNGTTYTLGELQSYYPGQRVSNFLIQRIGNDSVTGLIYVEYPLAAANGTPITLHLGATVGYNCDGTMEMFVGTDRGSATFVHASTGPVKGGCPI